MGRHGAAIERARLASPAIDEETVPISRHGKGEAGGVKRSRTIQLARPRTTEAGEFEEPPLPSRTHEQFAPLRSGRRESGAAR